jgi:predicted 3-demethylubiquinone-9 3-methyltransferase (glyoxalase superfamily)
VSWQDVLTVLKEMLADPDTSKTKRVMRTLLQTKKLKIAMLKKA